jgi:hypothetical protein
VLKFIKKLLKISPVPLMAIVAVLFFVVPKTAMAGFLMDGTVQDILIGFISAIVDIVGYALITFAGALVNLSFNLQSFVNVPIVQIGWTIVRDMVNMVFILIMLAVAFSTILQFQTYGWKKIIPKLVIIALTINFILIICGVITDFGNSMSSYFISAGSPNGTSEVGTNIMKAARAGALSQLRNDVNSSFTAELAALVMQLIFYIILAFILFAIGILMIYRLLALWVLIIVSPAAWISTIISPESFKNWWKKFINLAVILPVAMSFFVFFSIVLGSTFQGSPGMVFDIGSSQAGLAKIFPNMTFGVIMQFLVVMSFLGYGLTFATKTGVAGGAMVVNWAKKGKDWGMGKMKAAPRTIAGTAVVGVDKVSGGRATRELMRGREWLERQPLIGRAVGGPGRAFKEKQERFEKEKAKISKLQPQYLEAVAKQTAVTPEGLARRAAAITLLAEKSQLKDEHLPYIRSQSFVNSGGNTKDILSARMDFAYDRGFVEMMAKVISPLQNEWKRIAQIATQRGDGAMRNEIDNLIATKLIGKVEDFAKLQKEVIASTNPFSDRLKRVFGDQLREGGKLYTSHLNSLANKNEETYHTMIRFINDIIISDPNNNFDLKQSVLNHIIAGPGAQAFGAAGGGGGAAGGGGGAAGGGTTP